jgi:3'5'-cyclic nucleotide phosphodiesterase
MESTGKAGQIQISAITAERLIAAGKSHWINQRDDKVTAKGKGELQTYWLLPIRGTNKSHEMDDTTATRSAGAISLTQSDLASSSNNAENNIDRLVKWNVDILLRILKDIAKKRSLSTHDLDHQDNSIQTLESELKNKLSNIIKGQMTIDEVKETIEFPCIDNNLVGVDDKNYDETISFDEDVTDQLSEFIRMIAETYRSNYFHNFEHASHVTMSVTKLLSRIVATSSAVTGSKTSECIEDEKTMRHHIYRISSDPLTRFACVFSAIIHDCDHYGTSKFSRTFAKMIML